MANERLGEFAQPALQCNAMLTIPPQTCAVLVGIVRRTEVERYIALFTEAGILVSSFTFSAAAVHAAVRLNGAGHLSQGFVALSRSASGAVEVYGESQTRPVFSAEFDVADR